MNLWLLCCVLLFITSQGYGWLSQQPWFVMPELALPWILLGGTGLAIASNRHTLRKPSLSSTHQKPDLAATSPHADQLNATTSKQSAAIAQSKHAESMEPSPPPKSSASKKTSISFEIPRHQARSSN